MNGQFKSQFSWSVTRSSKFKTCQRAYYFHYYGSVPGWLEEAPERVKLAYRLKFLKNLVLMAGSQVHDTIKFVLLQYSADGRLMSLDEIKSHALQNLRESWRQAVRHDWEKSARAPKIATNIFELYYGDGTDKLPKTTTDAFVSRVMDALEGFYFSSALKDILAVGPQNWLRIDSMDTFNLFETEVYAVPDMAYRDQQGKVHIIDWKTGGEDRESLTLQLGCYAMYAKAKWQVDNVEDLVATGVFLNDGGRSRDYLLKNDDISKVMDYIFNSIGAMKAKLESVESNEPKDEDAFPFCGDMNTCEYCQFKQICSRE